MRLVSGASVYLPVKLIIVRAIWKDCFEKYVEVVVLWQHIS